jgi:glycosyltransferase involved in cell wall biosynthesis
MGIATTLLAGPPVTGRTPTRVLLLTEGTYPYRWGGVSTWCHALTHELADVRFSLLAIADDPRLEQRFELAPNVEYFRPVSVWGVRDSWEARDDLDDRALIRWRARATTDRAVELGFAPPFRRFVGALVGAEVTSEELALSLHELHRFFLTHDFDATLRSRPAWECFVDEVRGRFDGLAALHGYFGASLSLADLTAVFQWLHHWLFPLARPLPEVDVVHATMAGICTIVAAVAKVEQGAGLLLSEHGIYLRECYLAQQQSRDSLFRKLVKLRFARLATMLGYELADRVAPCCDYNRRWELRTGANPDRVSTAYYGLDPARYAFAPPVDAGAPAVAWAGRIDPLKDVETLLRASALVVAARPDARFRLFGSAPTGEEGYLARCLALHRGLGLEGAVTFEGFAEETSRAFEDADVVVLSSISEGFPYSTLEAMFCGRAIVATAVGGVAEQIGRAGVLVRPRDPDALAGAILRLLSDRRLRLRLGRAARARAESLFTIARFREAHALAYDALVAEGASR